MSCCEQQFEQSSFIDTNAANSRLCLSREASCCRGTSCNAPSAPIDSAFVGSNGDLQIVNGGAAIGQPFDQFGNPSCDQQPNAYGGRYQYLPSYGRGIYGHYRPNIAHAVADVITQRHSGYYQPSFGSWNYSHHAQTIGHVISDLVTQRHGGYYQPSFLSAGHQLRHLFGGHRRFR